jgi:hypothetical protein
MNVPACVRPVLSMFRPTFSTPTYDRFLVLAVAAVLTTGRRTVTNLLRTVQVQALGLPLPIIGCVRGAAGRRGPWLVP